MQERAGLSHVKSLATLLSKRNNDTCRLRSHMEPKFLHGFRYWSLFEALPHCFGLDQSRTQHFRGRTPVALEFDLLRFPHTNRTLARQRLMENAGQCHAHVVGFHNTVAMCSEPVRYQLVRYQPRLADSAHS
jgi:hypothetical protein